MPYDRPPQAPATNRRAVSSPEYEGPLLTSTGKPLRPSVLATARSRLGLFRQALQAADSAPLGSIEHIEADSKAMLVHEAYALIRDHMPPEPSELSLRHAALAGVGVTMAFLDVTTRVVAQEQLGREKLPPVLRKSVKTVLELATHSEEADKLLTIGLSAYSEREIAKHREEYLMEHLRFQPRFFTLNEGAVEVDYAQRKSMRPGGRKIDFMPRNDEVLLGCPFFSRINQLYKGLTVAALHNGIIDDIYHEELNNSRLHSTWCVDTEDT